MSEAVCQWLHGLLDRLPAVKWPFRLEDLPGDGIYFLYEDGETRGHDGGGGRIVRIGTHRDGNFRSRIAEHFLFDEGKMEFDATRVRPHDRSIFRDHIGRALLNRANDSYLPVWRVNLTASAKRAALAPMRDIEKEKAIEDRVTRILRERFAFRWVAVAGHDMRRGLEAALIGTAAQCEQCRASPAWLGQWSPESKVRESGLWQVQHLGALPLDDEQRGQLDDLVRASVAFAG